MAQAPTHVVLLTRGELVDMTTLTFDEYRRGVDLNQARDPFGFRFESPDPVRMIGLTGAEVSKLLADHQCLAEHEILNLMPHPLNPRVPNRTRDEILRLVEEMVEAKTKTVSPNNKSVTSDTSTNTGGETSED